MLYNLDRNTKRNILEEYKQEAIKYRQRNENERLKRIQEEREYILERTRKEQESELYLKQAKLQEQNELMKEYYDSIRLLKIDKPGYHFIPSKKEVVNKNWGNRSYEYSLNNTNRNNNNSKIIKDGIDNNKGDSYQNNNNNISLFQKDRDYVRKKDIMNDFLTSRNNTKELEIQLKQEKQKRIKYYKDILDSQYSELQNNFRILYGTRDPVIIKRIKKNSLTDNPYAKKWNYDFGNSKLSHNPITNPENDINYNKYLFKVKNKNDIYNLNNYKNNVNNNAIGFNNNKNKLVNDSQNNFIKNRSQSCINIFRNIQENNFNPEKNILNKYNNYNYNYQNGNNMNDKNYPRNIIGKAVSSNFLS
jgi:hypothetical protein